ncbi:YetF domain-containing protein [Oceanobacillus longus]|uniref:YetF domain-containing protein n=1 Tax=Oceanobacillus longus TaxID=930120 RepID=A0ABV8H3C2_9BACI
MNGQLSVMLKTDQQPVTPHTLGIPIEQEHGPTILIMDGQLLEKGLKERGFSKEWLLGEVQKQGAEGFKEVFLAQIDSRGNVYVDLYENKEKRHIVEERPLQGAILKKIQADLESFSLQTDNPEAKKLYAEQAANLQKTIDSIIPYLK